MFVAVSAVHSSFLFEAVVSPVSKIFLTHDRVGQGVKWQLTSIKKMNKYLFSILNFEKLWRFMPLVLFLLYIPQAVVGIFIFRDAPAFELAGVMLLGLFTYLLIYFWLSKSKISEYPSLAKLAFGERFPSHYAIMTISVCYFVVILYAVLTSEKIALWEALSGASVDDIAYAREALFKSRVGWERSLAYVNAIFSSALMPFALVICYLEKKTYRHALLVMFVVSLLPSMEKVLILKALLPLIALGFNGYFPKRRVIQFSMVAVAVIAGAFFFSKMGKIDPIRYTQLEMQDLQGQQIKLSEESAKGQKALEKLRAELELYDRGNSKQIKTSRHSIEAAIEFYQYEQPRQIAVMERAIQGQLAADHWAIENFRKQNVFGPGQISFVINRVLWIPYITAYDWLGFFHKKLSGEYLLGRTSGLIGLITGKPNFPMEREVFSYQFGGTALTTAAANACFLVDAFVNFGWIGVIVYAGLFSVLTWVVVKQGNLAMQACYYYFALQASMGGLSGVLFSNGMIFLICLAFFVRPKLNVVAH